MKTGYAYLAEVAPFPDPETATAANLSTYFAARAQIAYEQLLADRDIIAATDRFNGLACTAYLLRVLADIAPDAADEVAAQLTEWLHCGDTLQEMLPRWLAGAGVDPARITPAE